MLLVASFVELHVNVCGTCGSGSQKLWVLEEIYGPNILHFVLMAKSSGVKPRRRDILYKF